MSEIYTDDDKAKIVYICSPYRGNIRKNSAVARRICRNIILKYHSWIVPIAPHLLYTQFLSDNVDGERELGLSVGRHLLATCDELWAYLPDNGPTDGMKGEMAMAKSLGITIREFDFPVRRKVQK